jgi:protein tyrosine phosphatase
MNVRKGNGRPTIEIAGREMNYFFTDRWEDHEEGDPERLIALVKAVMGNERESQMVAVHCRAGVGRTGTFLAAYALIFDIDEQVSRGVCIDEIEVSVDKVIWQLSLQRPFMVAQFSQYRTLYELVDRYVSMRKNAQKTG